MANDLVRVDLNFARHRSFLRVRRKVGRESKNIKFKCLSVLDPGLFLSQFIIFGIPRSVIMTIIVRLKTNKLARQNIFFWEPYEWLFLS